MIKCRRTISVGNVKNSEKSKSVKGHNKTIVADSMEKEPLLRELSPAMEKKRQMVLMEIEVFRQSGELDLSADELTARDWKEILDLGSPQQRKKYYIYTMKRKLARAADKRRKERKNAERIERERENAQETAGHIQYGLGRNTMYYRIRESSMTEMYNSRLAHAVIYGQKLVFDLGFNQHMRSKDIRSCVKQLQYGYGYNVRDEDPFHLHLCNARHEEALLPQLQLAIPPLAQPKGLVTVTDKSYLDLFPKDKLVYLTPDCREDLEEYDHDAIYIIGCFVDMANSLPVSLAKAKQEGLKMARLPLERYLRWTSGGNKSLTIDQMMNVMLTVKNTGNWATALKHVPIRKLVDRNYIQRGPYRQRGDSLFGKLQ